MVSTGGDFPLAVTLLASIDYNVVDEAVTNQYTICQLPLHPCSMHHKEAAVKKFKLHEEHKDSKRSTKERDLAWEAARREKKR